MSPLFRDAVFAAIGFAYPILLGYSGPGVTPLQVYVGMSITGVAYFAVMAWSGCMQVGTISAWSVSVILVCGVLGAFGFAKYLAILSSPIHVGIALTLTQIIIVLGCTILHGGGLSSLGLYRWIGLIFASIGIYLMNLK